MTLGAIGQGMVAGDLVNTASRIQSIAEPGAVLVGETTKRATEAAVAYDERRRARAEGQVRARRALPGAARDRRRGVERRSRRPSSRRSSAATASFGCQGALPRVRRGRQGAARRRSSGSPASASPGLHGSSRSTSTGSPRPLVAPRPLPRLRRRRRLLGAGGDGADARRHPRGGGARTRRSRSCGPRSRSTSRTPDERELARAAARASARPRRADGARPRGPLLRLAALLRAAGGGRSGRPGLRGPAVGRRGAARLHRVPARVVARAIRSSCWRSRGPSCSSGDPGFGSGGRNSTTLSLEPLPDEAMDAAARRARPGPPEDLRAQILARAEGVPLYAVETVRMLLDRRPARTRGRRLPAGRTDRGARRAGVAACARRRAARRTRPRRAPLAPGRIGARQVIHASAAWRRWPGWARPSSSLCVTSLVRKEVLSIQADPRSPERGQYSFLQDLLKRVAYETLAKTRAQGAASGGGRAIWPGVRSRRAGDRRGHRRPLPRRLPGERRTQTMRPRSRLGRGRCSPAPASEPLPWLRTTRHSITSSVLPISPTSRLPRPRSVERAGATAHAAGRVDEAQRHYERARELYEQEGQTHPGRTRLGQAWRGRLAIGHARKALDRMERAFAVLSDDEPDEDSPRSRRSWADCISSRARAMLAMQRVDTAIEVAESLWLPEVLSAGAEHAGPARQSQRTLGAVTRAR